jgi:hypothetical protein
MTSDDLSPEQWVALSGQIPPMLGYRGRVSQRMAKAGFPPDDKLRVLVSGAEDAVHRLRIHTHNLGVDARRKVAAAEWSSNQKYPHGQ